MARNRRHDGRVSDDVTPFRIDIPEADLEDLRQRLRRTRWPEAATVDDWSQGIPLDYTRALCRYWLDSYDWRARESRLNSFPQFRTEIDGLDIHFLHIRSPREDALPLVITHGWPGSMSNSARSSGRSPIRQRTAGTPRTPSTWSARRAGLRLQRQARASRDGGLSTPPTPGTS